MVVLSTIKTYQMIRSSCLIDKAKYYAFKVDDVDEVQADIEIVNKTTQDASEQMKITVDTDVLGLFYSNAGNTLATTIVTALMY